MEIRVPDHLVSALNLSPSDCLLSMAIGLFMDRRVTLGRGAEIAGISKPAFLHELGHRKIPINYDQADLESDLRTIASLRKEAIPTPQ